MQKRKLLGLGIVALLLFVGLFIAGCDFGCTCGASYDRIMAKAGYNPLDCDNLESCATSIGLRYGLHGGNPKCDCK